jgi:hypothetical protein
MTKPKSNKQIEELLGRIVVDLLPKVGAKVDGELMSQGRGIECGNCPLAKQGGI